MPAPEAAAPWPARTEGPTYREGLPKRGALVPGIPNKMMENDGKIWENDGNIWENDGTIWESDGTIWENDGTIWENGENMGK